MKFVNVDTGEELETDESGVTVEHGIQAAIAGTGLQIWRFADGSWSYGFSVVGDSQSGQQPVGIGDDGFVSEYDALHAFLVRLADHDVRVEVVDTE